MSDNINVDCPYCGQQVTTGVSGMDQVSLVKCASSEESDFGLTDIRGCGKLFVLKIRTTLEANISRIEGE